MAFRLTMNSGMRLFSANFLGACSDVFMVGSRTIHMSTTNSLPNQPNPVCLGQWVFFVDNILSPEAVAAGFTPPYPGFVNDLGGSATVEEASTPFPMFGGYYDSFEMGWSLFLTALQIQGEKEDFHSA